MKSLENQFISDTYKSLLHTLDDNGVPTTGLDDIYDGGGNQTALSLGAKDKGAVVSGSFTAGNVTYPTSSDAKALIDVLFPVGSVYFTAVNQNTATFMGGSWSIIADGRFIAGVGTGTDSTGNQNTINAGNNQGNYQKSLDASNLPAHYHYVANADIIPATTSNDLTESKSVAVGAAVSLDQAYYLKGTTTQPTLGRTSTVGNTAATDGLGSPVSLTPPSFGLYIWKRTA
jgi:hypothetical protein